jgi:hypothetical protein
VPQWLPLLIVGSLGVMASFFVGSILVVGLIQKQTRLMIEAIQNQPIPPVERDTIVKVVSAPTAERMEFLTPVSLVAEVAAELEHAGTPMTDDERTGQLEAWEDYGIDQLH